MTKKQLRREIEILKAKLRIAEVALDQITKAE